MQAKFTLKSEDFENNKEIPVEFTCQGQDKSPELSWNNAPVNTKSFVLIVDDPDAPTEKPFVHWVIFNIPGNKNKLNKSIKPDKQLEDKSIQGKNSFGKIGYGGPCPPAGKAHRYFFKLYAIDKSLNLESGASKEEVLNALKNNILAETQLIGLYARK